MREIIYKLQERPLGGLSKSTMRKRALAEESAYLRKICGGEDFPQRG